MYVWSFKPLMIVYRVLSGVHGYCADAYRAVAYRVATCTVAMTFVIAALSALPLLAANAQTYYLGVLAPQGETAAQKRWQPWLDTLNSELGDDTIVLVPLTLENWQQQIEAQQFTFVLGPQVQFIKMETTGWRWLATLQAYTAQTELFKSEPSQYKGVKTDETESEKIKSKKTELAQSAISTLVNEPSAMEQVASALWVKADSNIYQLQDLQQRKIVAVDADAFGGYLLSVHLLQQNGVPSSRYQTQFVGYPIELTLSTLASGAVDAAIAPLCLMEEMARQGKIDKSRYRLIHKVKTSSSCQSSTKIYPNWTLAATMQAPATLVTQINQHLFDIQRQTPVNNADSNFVSDVNGFITPLRWLPPESSSDTERILYEMNRHPAQKQLGAHMLDWIHTHRLWMAIIVFIIMISTVNYGWMSWLAWRRRQQILLQNQILRDYDHQLRQSERFAVIGEMSGAIAHEINQPLATIQNYAQGLLIRSQHARSDKASTETALQQIVSETERVAAVVANIRRWAGKSQPSAAIEVNIAATYQQCIMLLGDKAAGISFWFASDYQQLQLPKLLLDQLFINSVLNAQQQGAAHIMLRCQMAEVDGTQWLVIHITDDGGGFDEERLASHQASAQSSSQQNQQQYAARSTKADGLGMGLMICQRLCKSLGGMMQLRNVDVETELAKIHMMDSHYQQRIKRTLNGKVQLTATDTSYPLVNRVGAQVSLYLPLYLMATKDSDTKVE